MNDAAELELLQLRPVGGAAVWTSTPVGCVGLASAAAGQERRVEDAVDGDARHCQPPVDLHKRNPVSRWC
jgi:hypothetical protein